MYFYKQIYLLLHLQIQNLQNLQNLQIHLFNKLSKHHPKKA